MSPSSCGIRRVLGSLRSGALLAVAAVSVGAVGVLSSAAVTPTPAAAANWAPVRPGDFPDPSVLQYGGVYYAYATQSLPSISITNIQVSTSSDGLHWTQSSTDALPGLPSWASGGETWAPTVAYNGSEFVMYYAATVASDGLQCIGLATASSPLGPYTDTSANPAVCQTGIGGSIDPDIFTDNSGHSYLLWKNDGNRVGVQVDIWSTPLDASLTGLGPNATELLQSDQSWQGGVIEGPDMIETSSGYYLFYGGNAYASPWYAIGWASCPSGPTAACSDGPASSNPILTSAPGMSGPGGPDVFSISTANGRQLVMAFAAWQGSTIGYLACGIRPMYLATLSFSAGTPPTPELGPAVSATAAQNSPCPATGIAAPPSGSGYWLSNAGGVVSAHGVPNLGSMAGIPLNAPISHIVSTPDGNGYWLVAADGGTFAFGDAGFYGSMGGKPLNAPVVNMAPTPDGGGYWLVASDGGVFAFGDATFFGSMGGRHLNAPIVGMAADAQTGGYWLVASDGGIFSFGAPFFGSTGNIHLQQPINGMGLSGGGSGYWLVASDGGIFAFGGAPFWGSTGALHLVAPVMGMAADVATGGYWLVASDGGVFSFDAPFYGAD